MERPDSTASKEGQLMTVFKVGELVKWHNTTAGKWRRGMIITVDPHPSPSSSTTYTVLWANGEKKLCREWQLLRFNQYTLTS